MTSAISLQLLPQNSMIDLVQMAGHLDEKGLESVVTRHESGLDAACAPAEPSDADRIPGQTVSELLKVAKRKYDFIVVDTPPAFTEHVLAAFDNSDLLVLIATLDIPAVKNLRLTLDTLDLLGSPKEDRVIVLNRSDAKVGLRSEDVVAVDQAGDRGDGAQQHRRPGFREPGRPHRPGRAEAPGERRYSRTG